MDKLDLNIAHLDANNVKIAGRIQHKIFPYSSSYSLYLDEVEKKRDDYNDYIIRLNTIPIGIIGYSLDSDDKQTVWLSWFGILPDYRKKGLGKQALDMLCDIL